MFSRLMSFIIIFVAAHVHAKSNRPLQYHLSSKALYIESSTQQARNFGIAPAISFEKNLFEQIDFQARASALLETGAHKGTVIDEFKPDQQVLLDYAFFSYRPWSEFFIHAGAISMRERAPDLLIDSSRFLGAVLEQSFNPEGAFGLKLHALSAIPSNQELSNRLGSVSEGTPRYWQSGLDFLLPGDLLSLDVGAMAWSYANVTGDVAYQSGFMGNQTSGLGPLNTRLSYAYRGAAARFDLGGNINSWRWGVGADYVFNDGAPDGRNEAKRARLLFAYDTHQINLAWFEIEADAAISYYNSSLLGHTNRVGPSLAYRYQYTSAAALGFTLVRAKTVRSSLVQADQDAVSMWWNIDL